MQAGTYISGAGHIALLGWAVLGSSVSTTPVEPVIQVSDVALISEAQFAALISSPPGPLLDILMPREPSVATSQPRAPKADTVPAQAIVSEPDTPQSAGTIPNLTDITEPPKTDVQTEPPQQTEPPTTQTLGATLILPTAPVSNRDQNGQTRPDQLAEVDAAETPAPRIDTKAAPKPAPDALRDNTTETAATPDASATTPAPDTVDKAPDQASTEIITEAKQRPNATAPARSSRPRGRPAKLAASSNTPSEIEAALARAQAEAAANTSKSARATPSGAPLTGGEKDQLVVAVEKCWNVNPSSEAARVTVTVAVSLDVDGKPRASTIKMLSATDGTAGAVVSAFDAARRAILRCGSKGFELPPEKYDYWREVEMTFNPDKMRIK